MKARFIIVFALLGLLTSNAVAQTKNSLPDMFYSIGISYHPGNCLYQSGAEAGHFPMNAASIFWNSAIALSKHTPAFIEFGVAAQYSFVSFEESRGKTYMDDFAWTDEEKKWNIQIVSARMPVSFFYAFEIPNANIFFAPFAGIDGIINIWGQEIYRSQIYNVFDSNTKNHTRRFNLDWHAGLKLMIRRFFISASYEGPIVGFYQYQDTRMQMSQINLSAGFMF